MKYVVASTAVTDEIRFADGKNVKKAAGGAGIYALCGIKLWCDDVMIATGVGEDYEGIYGEWYRKNGLSMEGLLIRDAHTPHTIVQYFKDGEREETPLYGADHYLKIETTPEDLKPYFDSAEGIYIFKNSTEAYWKKILSYKKNSKTVLLWEIASDATYLENYETVKEIGSQVDIFSINLTESRNLMGTDELEKIIETYQSWGTPLIFLRRGSKGAIMITPSTVDYVPSVPDVQVEDPTGGGNSSTGAVLYGYCSGYSPADCGRLGSISAALCISQFGVPEIFDKAVRKEAEERLSALRNIKC